MDESGQRTHEVKKKKKSSENKENEKYALVSPNHVRCASMCVLDFRCRRFFVCHFNKKRMQGSLLIWWFCRWSWWWWWWWIELLLPLALFLFCRNCNDETTGEEERNERRFCSSSFICVCVCLRMRKNVRLLKRIYRYSVDTLLVSCRRHHGHGRQRRRRRCLFFVFLFFFSSLYAFSRMIHICQCGRCAYAQNAQKDTEEVEAEARKMSLWNS